MKKQQEQNLIDQLFMTLDTTYKQLQTQDQNEKNNAALKTDIEELLLGDKSWINGFKIEQLMIPLLYGEVLDAVLSKQLLNAKKLGENKSEYYTKQVNLAKTDIVKQAILKQLIQDVQWYYETKRIKQRYINYAWYIAIHAFIGCFLLFFLPQILPYFKTKLDAMGGLRAQDIYTAISSGALGASFSILIGLNERIKQSSFSGLKMLKRPIYTISKVVTGLGAGLIFFYFLQSGLLEGIAFPQFILDPISDAHVHKDDSSLALLVIWCFISGFSEKLIPTILSKTEEQVSVKSNEG